MKVYFARKPDEILRISEYDPEFDGDPIKWVNKQIQSLCDIHAAEDAYEEERITTCKENLYIFIKFLNI